MIAWFEKLLGRKAKRQIGEVKKKTKIQHGERNNFKITDGKLVLKVWFQFEISREVTCVCFASGCSYFASQFLHIADGRSKPKNWDGATAAPYPRPPALYASNSRTVTNKYFYHRLAFWLSWWIFQDFFTECFFFLPSPRTLMFSPSFCLFVGLSEDYAEMYFHKTLMGGGFLPRRDPIKSPWGSPDYLRIRIMGRIPILTFFNVALKAIFLHFWQISQGIIHG